MPAADNVPQQLRPYTYHKVELDWGSKETLGKEARGECPFCGGDKFFVSQVSGMYDCKTCPENGNHYTFIRKLHEYSLAVTSLSDLALVAEERKVSPKTLQRWGLVQSVVDREWMLPAYWVNGSVDVYNLYRWPLLRQRDGSMKRRLMGTSTMDARLFGMQFWDSGKSDVYVLEGPWDAMLLQQKMMQYDPGNDTLRTTDSSKSLYSITNIVAVPGCETFKDEWVKPFVGKRVYLGYDSDFPKHNEKTGKITPPPGLTGMQMVAKKLRPVASSLHYLDWGEDGYNPLLEDGFDVRDHLTR